VLGYTGLGEHDIQEAFGRVADLLARTS